MAEVLVSGPEPGNKRRLACTEGILLGTALIKVEDHAVPKLELEDRKKEFN